MPDPSGLLVALDVGRDEVRRAVDDVLSRPEYAELQRGGLRAWIADLRRRAAEWLAELLGQAGTAALAWALLGVAAVLVLLLAVRWARRLTAEPATAEAVLDGPVRRPAEWVAEAESLRAEGRHREAVRAAFRGVVAGHADAGTVEEIPGTTVGEYRRQVTANHPAGVGSFDEAADLFEQVWYGDRSASSADVDRLVAIARSGLVVTVSR